MTVQYIMPDGSITGTAIANGASIDWPNGEGGTFSVTVLLAEVTIPDGWAGEVATGIQTAAIRDMQKHNQKASAGGTVLAVKINLP